MTTFYVCRHGETENNRKKLMQGWLDSPLTDDGAKSARSAAAKLEGVALHKIVSSDLGRAFVSAYLIARELGFDDEIIRSADFREVNYGELANQPYDAYPEMSSLDKATYAPAGGESLTQMQQRVLTGLRKLDADNENADILVVGHDGTVNAIRANSSGENMGDADSVRNAPGFLASFNLQDGQVINFTAL